MRGCRVVYCGFISRGTEERVGIGKSGYALRRVAGNRSCRDVFRDRAVGGGCLVCACRVHDYRGSGFYQYLVANAVAGR